MELYIHHTESAKLANLPRRPLEVSKMLLYNDQPELTDLGGVVRTEWAGREESVLL